MTTTNAYLRLVERSAPGRRCDKPFCTTCGGISAFHRELRALEDLQRALLSVDLRALQAVKGWDELLEATWHKTEERVDWGEVLRAWLPAATENPRLAVVVCELLRTRPLNDRALAEAWERAQVTRF